MESAKKTDDIHFLPLLLDQRLRQLTAPRTSEGPNIDHCCRSELQISSSVGQIPRDSRDFTSAAHRFAHAYKNNRAL